MSELTPTTQALTASAAPLLALHPERAATGDPYQIYLDSLDSETSRATMRGCLDRIARMILQEEADGPLPHDPPVTGACRSWWALRYQHTARIRANLVADHPDWSYTYVNKHLSALRRVLQECWRLGEMSAEDYHRAIDIPGIEGSREKTGRNIRGREIAAMLQVCADGDGPRPVRDGALIAVLCSTGIRRAEAASALIERYDPGERGLKVIGKRNKERTVYLNPDAARALDRWLAVLGARRGFVFRRIDRWGNVSKSGMTPTAIGNIVDVVRLRAHLPALDTHDFRRTYAGALLNEGVDLSTVQKLMGHASPATTAGYDPRDEQTLRDASDRLSLPLPHNDRTET